MVSSHVLPPPPPQPALPWHDEAAVPLQGSYGTKLEAVLRRVLCLVRLGGGRSESGGVCTFSIIASHRVAACSRIQRIVALP